MITMKEIDVLRLALDAALGVARDPGQWPRIHGDEARREVWRDVSTARNAVEAALRQWWAQGCMEVMTEPCPPPPRPRITGRSPADKLADAVRAFRTNRFDDRHLGVRDPVDRLFDALEAYDSTRNGDPAASALFGSPPDPILVARHLLDALTGGALASLLCSLRDDVVVHCEMTTGRRMESMRANLKALGEKIDG